MPKQNKSKGGSAKTRGVSKGERGETMAIFINFETRDQRRHLNKLAKAHKCARKAVVIALIEEAFRAFESGRKVPALAAMAAGE